MQRLSLAEKNSFCAARWRELTKENREKYERQAQELKKGSTSSSADDTDDKVSRRVANYLSNVSLFSSTGTQQSLMYSVQSIWIPILMYI